MNRPDLQDQLAAYFRDKGQPVGEPLEEDLPPLLELLKALASLGELPSASRALGERLLLEQLPWVEDQLATAEVERLHALLATLCEPAELSPARDAAILRAIHAAARAPAAEYWFGWIPRLWGPGLTLCAGMAAVMLLVGRAGELPLTPPWLEIEKFRGSGIPIGQSVQVQLGSRDGGFFHLLDVDARRTVQVLVTNRQLAPGQKVAHRFVADGPPGVETLIAACTSGELPAINATAASASELKAQLTALARARSSRITFNELEIEVAP